MVSWLVGEEDDPLDVFELAKCSDISELRNWAARRALIDPTLDNDAWPEFVTHSPWDGGWSAETVPTLLTELREILILVDASVRTSPGNAWMLALLRKMIRAAEYAVRRQAPIVIR